jgi:branched-chain amino acid transport system substrate-binding protein
MLLTFGCGEHQRTCTFLTDLSGTQADFGSAARDGAVVAMKAPDKPSTVSVRFRDAGSDTTLAHAMAQAASTHSLVGIGFTDSDEALDAVPEFVKAGKPFMIVGATDPSLPQRCGPGVFMACFGDDAQADAAARFALRTFGRRAVLVGDSGHDYTRKLAAYFRERFTQGGGKIVGEADRQDPHVARRIMDFSNLKEPPDFIFLSSEPDRLSDILGSIRAAMPDRPILGGDGLDCAAVHQSGDHPSDRVFFATHAWFGDGATEAARRFADAYQSIHGKPPPNAFAALGHDAMAIVQNAISRTTAPTPDAIRDEIGRTRGFVGASGTISFEGGPVPQKDVWIVEMHRGSRRLADRITGAGASTR